MWDLLKAMAISAIVGLGMTSRTKVSMADELEDALRQVDNLRAGFDTPFDEVEKRCDALLQTYTAPEDQARIYYQLARVGAQSGLQRPAKAIEYVEKALDLPVDREGRVQLYMYWGCAIEVDHRGVLGEALRRARKQAAIPYLQGLRETLQYADEVQKLPLPPRWEPTLSDLRRKLDKNAMTARSHAMRKRERLLERLTRHQTSFEGQLAFLYSRVPFATDELEKLARELLQDEAAVDHLMARVIERVIREKARGRSPKGECKD